MSVVSIAKESLPDFLAGNGSIGTTEGKLSSVAFKVNKHIVIRADAANTSTIKVGRPGNAAGGFVLNAGDETTVYVESTNKVAVVGGAAGQVFNWVAA